MNLAASGLRVGECAIAARKESARWHAATGGGERPTPHPRGGDSPSIQFQGGDSLRIVSFFTLHCLSAL